MHRLGCGPRAVSRLEYVEGDEDLEEEDKQKQEDHATQTAPTPVVSIYFCL